MRWRSRSQWIHVAWPVAWRIIQIRCCWRKETAWLTFLSSTIYWSLNAQMIHYTFLTDWLPIQSAHLRWSRVEAIFVDTLWIGRELEILSNWAKLSTISMNSPRTRNAFSAMKVKALVRAWMGAPFLFSFYSISVNFPSFRPVSSKPYHRLGLQTKEI